MTTLVFVRHTEIGSHQFQHGAELPPDLLSPEIIDRWLDEGRLKAYDSAERRSLYRLLPCFSGVKERETLAQNELASYAIGE